MTCRSADEAFEAGVRDSANDPPPPPELVARIARLLGRDQPPAASEAA